MVHLTKVPHHTLRKISTCGALGVGRFYSTQVQENTEEQQLSQKELRDKAIADALAKDEEITAKNKYLRELKSQTKNMISVLNKTPSTLIESRLQKLQEDLNKLPQDKVKQLDEELEEFMNTQMQLPKKEVFNRPWAKQASQTSDLGLSQKLNSTTSMSYTNKFPNLVPTADHKPFSDQELYLRHLAHSRLSGNLGSKLADIYRPRDDVKNPKDLKDTSISTLLAAGCHLGHSKAMWRPSTQPFLYGEYDGIHLIDLNETIAALKRACKVIKGVSKKGGVILYVGTSKHWAQQRALEEAATRSKGYYIDKRWIPGVITNYIEVTRQIKGESKIEVDMHNNPTDRKIDNELLIKPDLIVILNPVENRTCINECILLRVPTIGLCDTDMEPSLLTYPIPCNDDSVRATSLILGVLSKAAEAGLEERFANLEELKSSQRNFSTSAIASARSSSAASS
ncbi:uncharacterized protein CANTADRAFT_22260 [Suhomyces tanzawaensis NRRL Y-17324]|uniref:Ribosomal protein S2 n=1 Tax=Suhomyces tanzawaensis NRRL Y-17324 TaxID=984487 RepID=A0A1E4SFE7_9ASCO|nr:uncharacterized protein CANTADRAFT_22260 [Suhomyces tanzawaensis NRRL Y-17324]ODV78237.1 hypothetical protein CANTADRAFT_22260 [Suhomyces tanzawaensis NRRL Y-17324]